MGRSYLRLLILVVAGSGLAPLVTVFASNYLALGGLPPDVPVYLLMTVAMVALAMSIGRLLRHGKSNHIDWEAPSSTGRQDGQGSVGAGCLSTG